MKSIIYKALATAGLLLFSTSATRAQLLYSANGWEASGSPAWTIGSLLGQNNWTLYSDQEGDPEAPNFHRVVGATTIGAQTITPKSGSRMHHNVSSNYAAVWTYVDLLGAFNGRTAGNNTVVVSSDIFLPGVDSASDHFHGFDAYDSRVLQLGYFGFYNNLPELGGKPVVLLAGSDPSEPRINAVFDRAYMNDQWHRATMVMDFDSRRLEAYLDGIQIAMVDNTNTMLYDCTLIRPGDEASTRIFADADLVSFPGNNTPTSNFFTDNYQVSAARSITFRGTLQLDSLSSIGDAVSPVGAFFELRNANGTVRNGFVSVRPPAFDGGYSVRIFDVPNGNYQLVIRAAGYLSRVVNVTVSGTGSVTVPTVTLLGGDANGDDIVDVLDLAALISAFDSVLDEDPNTAGNQSSLNWDAGTDYNYDGYVDVLDLAVLIANFDQSGEGLL